MEKEPELSVSNFYIKFKSLYDELDELQPLPECTCGASKKIAQREEDQHVHLFLGGLGSEQYAHVKTTILNSKPLPSLRRIYNLITREESHLTVDKERNVKTETKLFSIPTLVDKNGKITKGLGVITVEK
uniref:Retrotransposon gag domain-containing protein n=1 Tax=Cajanus cajan TaxID=3821 RepID=A0A151SEE4_CAJCA|nr:hypothetical protein KK1_024801 [Cajanus cajan]